MAPLPASVRRRRTPACKDNNPTPTAPRKRQRRASTSTTPEPAPPSSLPATARPVFPAKVLLEIVARSDARTLIRCAAVCKTLRRGILSPAFLRRVTGQENPADRIVPPRLLGYIHTFDEEKEDEELPDALFSVLHPDPASAGSSSFTNKHLARFVSRNGADLLGAYRLVTSRGGLVVLRRRHINLRKRSHRRSDMCVYNPITGERTFFSEPPGMMKNSRLDHTNVLFTAEEDGIACCFMLLVADVSGFVDSSCTIRIQTFSSDAGTWSPMKYVGDIVRPWDWLESSRNAVVLRGSLVHWLTNCCGKILTFDVGTSTPGSIKLPEVCGGLSDKLHLGVLPNGRLRLLAIEGFVVSVWLLSAGGGWDLAGVIDMEERLRSLCRDENPPDPARLVFKCSGERSGVALLQIGRGGWGVSCGWHIVLHVETGEMRKIWGPYWNYLLVEVDLPSRLQTMKTFL